MKRIQRTLITASTFLSLAAYAQNGRILKDPGLKKLNVFVGTWKAHNKPGAGDSSTSVYSCEWSLYGRFLVCDQLVNLPEGQTNNLSIYSYDSLSQHYLLSLVGIAHMDPFSIPVVARGDTLIYSGSYENGGVKVFTRSLNIFQNTSHYIYLSQSSKDSITWKTNSEGSSEKIKP